MTTDELDLEQIVAATAYVDIEAPPPDQPAAYVLFGTNQQPPVRLAVERYRRGLAPLIIATGGVNRHDGSVEGQEFRRQLLTEGVPDSVIRVEDKSANTWQNVEFSLPYLHEAIATDLPVVAVSKWFHRRAVNVLRSLLPDLDRFYAVSWDPVYGARPVTRTNWPDLPDGRRRVIREWQEVRRRVADGSFRDAIRADGAWG